MNALIRAQAAVLRPRSAALLRRLPSPTTGRLVAMSCLAMPLVAVPLPALLQLQRPADVALAAAPPPALPPTPASAEQQQSIIRRAWRRLVLAARCVARLATLALLALPLAAAAPLLLLPPTRRAWRALLVWSVRRAGATLIKLGQWAATRPDIFPPSVCRALSVLHAAVPPHGVAQTRCTLARALLGGRLPASRAEQDAVLGALFEDVEAVPLGSGCIGQVHLVRLAAQRGAADGDGGTAGRVAVVKVLREGVRESIELDMSLLGAAAALFDAIPTLSEFGAPKAVAEFRSHLLSQLDLRREASNLRRLAANFEGNRGVRFPRPLPLLPDGSATDAEGSVLLETFEDGEPVSSVVAESSSSPSVLRAKRQVASAGVRAFFQMVLADNFVHADLHPGNILVRNWGGGGEDGGEGEGEGEPVLVFLDAGLTVELSARDKLNFADLFKAVALGDGDEAARLMIERSSVPLSQIRDPEGFKARMARVVAQVAGSKFELRKVKIGQVLAEVLSASRQHRVPIEASYTNLVTAIIVIEGLGRQLDGELDLFKCAWPFLSVKHAAAML